MGIEGTMGFENSQYYSSLSSAPFSDSSCYSGVKSSHPTSAILLSDRATF